MEVIDLLENENKRKAYIVLSKEVVEHFSIGNMVEAFLHVW